MPCVHITFRYLQCNFEAFDLRELECKFDVILVDPPLEEYQRRGSGISHNWRPWAWDEVYRNSIYNRINIFAINFTFFLWRNIENLFILA
jgi:mRNA (2'-O-methyladenosine-N6-)-methyltransferase